MQDIQWGAAKVRGGAGGSVWPHQCEGESTVQKAMNMGLPFDKHEAGKKELGHTSGGRQGWIVQEAPQQTAASPTAAYNASKDSS
eukprot:1148407-Pelagomonas_calceolata.AAC.5